MSPFANLTYKYDGLGRKVYELETKEGAILNENNFIYDGWNVVAELTVDNGQWTIDKTYTWGLDMSGSLQGSGGVGGLLAVNSPLAKAGAGGFFFYCYVILHIKN